MDMPPFTIVHLIKCIDINLAKEVKDLYKENSKLLKIEKNKTFHAHILVGLIV